MKIIGSKKSLFAKTAVIGFIIPIISIVLLLLIRQDNARKMQRAAQTEARSYCNSVLKMSEVLANELAQDAATLMKKHFESSNDLSQAIDTSTKDITAKGIDSTILLFYNHNEKLFSNSNTPGSTTFYRNLEGFGNEQNPEIIAFQDQIYSTATVNIDKPGGSLVMLIPLEALFASIDRDKRLQKPEPLQNGQQLVSSSGSMIIVPIEAYNGSVTASVGVKFEHGLDQNSTIPSSQVLALGLLPLFGFFLFSYLLYRYFDSFAHYLETIRKILRREKNGVELFRRDHHLVKNEMPELSEIYTLIEESLKEKAQLGQVLDTVKAMLSLLQEKGHDESGLNGIVELIVNFTGSTSGAIFASDSGDDRTDLIGLHNCDKELLSGIIQTGAGRSFIKAVRKNETILYLRTEELAAEPWSKLFDGYQQIVAIPLIFKAQFEGFLVLLSTERDLSIRIPEYFDGLIGEFLADIAYSVGIEKENLARQDKTKILQETSLAISSKLDLPSVLQVVASHLTEYAGATYCMIILNTDFENTLEVASLYSKRQNGISIPEASRINAIDLPKVKEAIEGKRTLIFGPQELADFGAVEKRFFRAESVKQLTILPISHSAKTIGAVVLGEERSQSRATLAPERLSFVQAIVSQAASAIENARLYGFINNKVDQLTTLYEVGAVIHSETNIKSMLEKVLGAIHDYLHYTVSGIYTIDDKNNTLRPLVVNAVNFETGTDKIALRAPDCVSELVVANGKPLNIADFRVEENIKPSFPSLLSELAVPIKLGTKNIGVFTVGSRAKCAFTEMHENFMRALSAQLAVSMERARLFEQEHERGLKLNTIFEISKKLSKSLNVQEVIKIASDSIQEAFHHQLVAVFLLDRVNRRYYTGYQASSSDKKLPDDFAIAEGCGLVGTAIKSRKTIYIPDVYSEPEYVLGIEDVKSEICIPIILGDKILGVLDAESMELNGFTTEDISTLEAVADIMAVAIDNSYLFEETIQKAERLSLIDNINKAISATLDLDSFFRVVAKAVADNAGYRWTSLVVPDGESFIFKAGYAPKSVGIISTESMLEMLKSRLKSVIEQCAPEFLSFAQLVALGAPEKLQSVVDAGIRNLALFPIGDATRAEAVMIVGSANSDGFTVQELQLLKDLA
ncbi:MAG TPA: hypothetical protein DEO84_09870, partial [candidate division Zixibacteria bacterium]|nr:hypothetical protein [candidate division Zixibacteria bacterium]